MPETNTGQRPPRWPGFGPPYTAPPPHSPFGGLGLRRPGEVPKLKERGRASRPDARPPRVRGGQPERRDLEAGQRHDPQAPLRGRHHLADAHDQALRPQGLGPAARRRAASRRPGSRSPASSRSCCTRCGSPAPSSAGARTPPPPAEGLRRGVGLRRRVPAGTHGADQAGPSNAHERARGPPRPIHHRTPAWGGSGRRPRREL